MSAREGMIGYNTILLWPYFIGKFCIKGVIFVLKWYQWVMKEWPKYIRAWNRSTNKKQDKSTAEYKHLGTSPKNLKSVAIIFGDLKQYEKITEESNAFFIQKLVPAVGRVIDLFDEYNVSEIVLYDLEGFIKRRRRDIGKLLTTHRSRHNCSIKYLCYQDWIDCIEGVTKSLAEAHLEYPKKRVSPEELDARIKSYEFRALDNGKTETFGEAPDMILVVTQKRFSLDGFVPWYTRTAEVYHLKDITCSPCALKMHLESILKKYFGTKQRFGT